MQRFFVLLFTVSYLLVGMTANSCRDPRDPRTEYTMQLTIALVPRSKKTGKALSLLSYTTTKNDGKQTATSVKSRTCHLPLNPHTNQVDFTIQYTTENPKQVYTALVTITYQRHFKLISPRRGSTCVYSIQTVKLSPNKIGHHAAPFAEPQEIKLLNHELSSFNEPPDVQIFF